VNLRNRFSLLLYIVGVVVTCFIPLTAVSTLYYALALALIVFSRLAEATFIC
jgi:hypothetical protein